MTQTAETTTTAPAALTWPTFRAAVLAWRDEQPDPRHADIAAFCLIDAARNWWMDAMQLHAYTVQHLAKYTDLCTRANIDAVRYTIQRDYYTDQGDTESAERYARHLSHC